MYADLKMFNRKIGRCKNNPQNSFTTKVREHILSGFLMSKKVSMRIIMMYAELKIITKIL